MANASSSNSYVRPIAIAPSIASVGSAQTVTSSGAAATPSNILYACVTCTKRKVKCDKIGPPCTTCLKGRHECRYEAPAPRQRKRKAVDPLHEKLEYYEGLLKQHGLISELAQSPVIPVVVSAPVDKVTSSAIVSPLEQRPGKLLTGQNNTRYIDSALWHNLEGEIDPSSEDDDVAGPPRSAMSFDHPALDPVTVAMFSPASQSLVDVHPTYEVAMKLWGVYVSHVEPITKTFHVPTALAMVQRAAANPSAVSRAVECLLFAIYHFALTAMNEDECMEIMGRPKVQARRSYYEAVKQALVNAQLLRTADFMVLQAYTLFLLAVRNIYDPHTFWIMTGTAMRIAQRIGVHRDGENLGLKPFEVQMRRRLFWQMLPLDGMASQLSGARVVMPFDSWDTKQPLNVNDEDLHPDMVDPPVERRGATDMVFCLARAEIGKCWQKIDVFSANFGRLGSDAIKRVEADIDEAEDDVEKKFLRYCDFIEPTQCLAIASVRSALTRARLRLRLPRVKANLEVSTAEQSDMSKMVMKIMDWDIMVHTNPGLSKFLWHTQAYFQFEPLIWALNELREGSSAIANPDDAWSKIEQVFACHLEFITTKRALHVAVAKLTIRAWEARFRRKGQAVEETALIARLRSSFSSKGANDTSGGTAAYQYNPWDPHNDNANFSAQIDPALSGSTEPVTPMDFGVDNIDWTFWDELIRAPETLLPDGAENLLTPLSV